MFITKRFNFLAEINDKKIPVVCIRHMSRFKPCFDSIHSAWRYQLKCLSQGGLNGS